MRNWSLALKLFVITLVLLLLSIGLCGAGITWETERTPAQEAEMRAGMICLILSGLSLLASIVVAIFQSGSKDDMRK